VAYVYRRAPGGRQTEVARVELAKIMERKSPMFRCKPMTSFTSQTIRAGVSLAQAIDRLAGLGSATATNYIIWH